MEVITKEYWENGRKRLRKTLHTPVGDVWKILEPESAYDSSAEFEIVEALTPPPMGDVFVKEARELWSDKALWINFTSSVHIESPESVEAHARELLQQAGTKKGFAIGITEDAPVKALEQSLAVISRVINEYQ